MATLTDILRADTELDASDINWLRLLVGDWQILSDLTFADMVLWVPTAAGEWLIVAHARPTTGRMVFAEDIVGTRMPRRRRPALNEAYASARIVRDRDPGWIDDDGVRIDAIPVVHEGRAIAVMSRCTNPAYLRVPSRLELSYMSTGDALCRMTASGAFPSSEVPTGQRRGAPRIGDGMLRLDVDGVITYASPNAVSGLHRIGHVGPVIGAVLAEITTEALRDHAPVDETLALVVTGRAPWRTEVETRAGHLTMRAIPLTERGERVGALIVMRDVSELRRRERELMTKDATIREIHHRVKNNLQTVAAVLRLQARRLPPGDARVALDEAVRRVGTIAMVHETLSKGFDEQVDFDEVVKRSINAVVEVARTEEPVRARLEGSFGRLRAEDATSLSMVMAELVSNAVEHGLSPVGGDLVIEARRGPDPRGTEDDGDLLTVTVSDDGAGLPADFTPYGDSLGTQIVSSLVQDLRGRITWSGREPRGTEVRFTARLRKAPA